MSAASFFAPGGPLSQAHPAWEPRPGQAEMADAVEETLRDGGSLMVEAGTGTGKTLAYLVPAVESGLRVVVSTGTRNLQDQIFSKDLPLLAERAHLRFSACLMKGRENYLCRYRHAQFEEEPLLEVRSEASWLGRIREWSRETRTGDRAEIPDLPDQLRMWRDVNARADTCTGRRCPEFESCWLTVMRRRAEASRIVVVNHHLFFADVAVRGRFGAVIPDYDAVVFDEAHLIEDIATLYFGIQVASGQLDELARDAEALLSRRGQGGAAGAAVPLRAASRAFFDVFREALRGASARVRLDPVRRGGPDLDDEWDGLSGALEDLARTASAESEPAAEAIAQRAEDLRETMRVILERDDPQTVYGMEPRGRAGVALSASPVDVSDRVREAVFDRVHAAVLTSATLAVGGRFDFFRRRLGLDHARTLVVESPFDHESQAVLYLPRRIPEPRESGFARRAVEEILALLEITEGRAFLLFTSWIAMARVREALERDGRWPLFVQGEGTKVALVERFRNTPRGVLLGTASFWHGVDVQGEALSLVVVDKLPFDVPDDPLVAARIERVREEGGNAFAEYQTPLAVLELKQGLGRLIRRRSDRGILAVLDPRLLTRSYGKTFLASLPPYRVVRTLDECRSFFGGEASGTGERSTGP